MQPNGPDTADLVSMLSLTQDDGDLFSGRCHAGAPLRAFGGQVAAQALTAAGRTIDAAQSPNSLHGYFLRAGDPRDPIEYRVERLHDGGTYANRRVTATQRGEAIFTLSASFKRPEEGYDRHVRIPSAAPPEQLTDPLDDPGPHPDYADFPGWGVISMRFVPPAEGSATPGQNEQLVWIRATQPLPDEPLLHVCALAYASDLSLASTAALDLQEPPPIRTATPRVRLVSLDHAMWFHRPFRADNWLLFATRSRTAGDGRGLATGEFFARDGLLVASVTQEALLRPIAEPRKS